MVVVEDDDDDDDDDSPRTVATKTDTRTMKVANESRERLSAVDFIIMAHWLFLERIGAVLEETGT